MFQELESRIISALGLFYKNKSPSDLYSFIVGSIGVQHKARYGELLTPVQASVRRAVDTKQYVSISAPTSAGKSYSIRDFLAEQAGDAVVVVPSRALIAEYVNTMKRRFDGDKSVMVSAFVDNVFTNRELRRIFVLTPERARDLFVQGLGLDIRVFFFDEAQMSEELERGVIFDVLIRRIQKSFPHAKLIFAHPFVDNPEAQFKKHGIPDQEGYAKAYTYGTVGKICLFRHDNGKDYVFSPHEIDGRLLRNCLLFDGGFEAFALNSRHSILMYVSKSSIYNGKFMEGLEEYVARMPEVEDDAALGIIAAVEHLVGADEKGHNSLMVNLLRKGVVIHHGSVPLEVRFLVEDFIRGKHAKVCFATSTLAQGVNMPFDIVWLDNMRFLGQSDSDKSLAFKNLVGRAGRLSEEQVFDFGFVYTKNAKLFCERMNGSYRLREDSLVDSPEDCSLDSRELVESIRDGTFNDELHIPQSKVNRLSAPHVVDSARKVIDLLYYGNRAIRENIRGQVNKSRRDEVKRLLKLIFEASISRVLYYGEEAVFDNAIAIFLQLIQGTSFRENVGLRYSRITNRDSGRAGYAQFTQPASKLPNSNLTNRFSIFSEDVLARSVSYDTVVFDTYDYLDQVISFSLSDVF